MNRILLLCLGLLLVLGLVLAPPPSELELFHYAAGELLAGNANDGPVPALDPLQGIVPGADAPPTSATRIALGEIQTAGLEIDNEQLQKRVQESLERAMNRFNGPPPEENETPRVWPRVTWVDDPGESDVRIDLQFRRLQEGRLDGLEVALSYQGPPSVPEVEPASFSYPQRTALLPPLLAIVIAISFRKVLFSLFAGVWLAGSLLTWSGNLASPWGSHTITRWLGGENTGEVSLLAAVLEGFLRVFDTFFYQQLVDSFRIEIIGFTMFLTAAVGVMSRSGGMAGLVQSVVKLAKGVRSSQFATWLMGLAIFFDDYANCIMVGTTMRPVTDRLRIAREKLAFLVDATAAPVAALSILSTWIAFEVSTFSAQLPGIGVEQSAYEIFLLTIPYRYYAIFMLAFVAMNILLQRDYGPMLQAEKRSRTLGQLVNPSGKPMVSDKLTKIDAKESIQPQARRSVIPIASVLLVTLSMIWIDGGGGLPWTEAGLSGASAWQVWNWQMPDVSGEKIRQVLFDGSGAKPILYGAFTGLVMAFFMALGRGPRWGLALGWIAAAWLTHPMTKTVNAKLVRTLEPMTEGDSLSSITAGFVLAPIDGSFGTAIHYAVFLVLFLCFAAALGLLASTLLGEEKSPNNQSLRPDEALRAAINSSRALVLAIGILFLAWMIGAACTQLGTASYLVAQVSGYMGNIYWLLPILLFLVSCLVSFSTGSSWSTMGILLPIVVALAFQIGEQAEGITGLGLLILSIGAVLEGSIFGDHCSPISDTTVLSSVSSASDHIDHVRTQMPYAVTVMVVALGIGYLPQGLGWWSHWVSLGAGIAALFAILVVVGRRPPDPILESEPADRDPEPARPAFAFTANDPSWNPPRRPDDPGRQ